MKDINLLVWLSQLGMSVAFPLGGFILLAVWLHRRFEWGTWVIWVGAALGLLFAIDGLRVCLKSLSRLSQRPSKEPPAINFNEHD